MKTKILGTLFVACGTYLTFKNIECLKNTELLLSEKRDSLNEKSDKLFVVSDQIIELARASIVETAAVDMLKAGMILFLK
jgi:hypothetical protein